MRASGRPRHGPAIAIELIAHALAVLGVTGSELFGDKSRQQHTIQHSPKFWL